MKVTVKTPLSVLDAEGNPKEPRNTTLNPGTYQLAEIANPIGERENWLVVAGTKKGRRAGWWKTTLTPAEVEFES